MMNFQDLVHRKVIVLSSQATLFEAAKAMDRNGTGCVLVAGPEGGPAGIVTDRDLAGLWTGESHQPSRTLDEIMSRDLITAEEGCGLKEVVRLMEDFGVRRIPIVSRGAFKKFTGLVTLDDLLAAKLIPSERVATIVKRQIGRRFFPGGRIVQSDERARAHREQSMHKFREIIRTETSLQDEQIEPLAIAVLGNFVMRVTYSAAANFCAQLPSILREKLFDLPGGPDPAIELETILREVESRLSIDRPNALCVTRAFIKGLSRYLPEGVIDHLRAQFPQALSQFIGDAVIQGVPDRPAA